MANLHFVLTAPVQGDATQETGRQLVVELEVEGSAPIKSRADLGRAVRALGAGQLAALGIQNGALGDFTITETREIEKADRSPLEDSAWPGVFLWKLASNPIGSVEK